MLRKPILLPHGEFELQWHKDILVVAYKEAWNREAVLALHAAARISWTAPPHRPWAMLSDLRNWAGGTPEALDAWWDFFSDAVSHGMTTSADVIPSTLQQLVVKDLYAKANTIATLKRCQTMHEAWQWLNEKGYGSGAPAPD